MILIYLIGFLFIRYSGLFSKALNKLRKRIEENTESLYLLYIEICQSSGIHDEWQSRGFWKAIQQDCKAYEKMVTTFKIWERLIGISILVWSFLIIPLYSWFNSTPALHGVKDFFSFYFSCSVLTLFFSVISSAVFEKWGERDYRFNFFEGILIGIICLGMPTFFYFLSTNGVNFNSSSSSALYLASKGGIYWVGIMLVLNIIFKPVLLKALETVQSFSAPSKLAFHILLTLEKHSHWNRSWGQYSDKEMLLFKLEQIAQIIEKQMIKSIKGSDSSTRQRTQYIYSEIAQSVRNLKLQVTIPSRQSSKNVKTALTHLLQCVIFDDWQSIPREPKQTQESVVLKLRKSFIFLITSLTPLGIALTTHYLKWMTFSDENYKLILLACIAWILLNCLHLLDTRLPEKVGMAKDILGLNFFTGRKKTGPDQE